MMHNDPLMEEQITLTRRQFIHEVQNHLSVERSVLAGHQSHGAAQIMWRNLGGTDHRPPLKGNPG